MKTMESNVDQNDVNTCQSNQNAMATKWNTFIFKNTRTLILLHFCFVFDCTWIHDDDDDHGSNRNVTEKHQKNARSHEQRCDDV